MSDNLIFCFTVTYLVGCFSVFLSFLSDQPFAFILESLLFKAGVGLMILSTFLLCAFIVFFALKGLTFIGFEGGIY